MMLAATTILSQFFRASTSVIAPELIRDLSLSPEALGFASGSFFLALLLPQIFVGVLFDRIGPRITVSALSVLMVAGALLHSVAESGTGLAIARFVVGLGCAGSFMSAVVLISRWYPKQSWSTALSWVFALSQIGFLLAGLPLAIASEWLGWRTAFVVLKWSFAIVANRCSPCFFTIILPASSTAGEAPLGSMVPTSSDRRLSRRRNSARLPACAGCLPRPVCCAFWPCSLWLMRRLPPSCSYGQAPTCTTCMGLIRLTEVECCWAWPWCRRPRGW